MQFTRRLRTQKFVMTSGIIGSVAVVTMETKAESPKPLFKTNSLLGKWKPTFVVDPTIYETKSEVRELIFEETNDEKISVTIICDAEKITFEATNDPTKIIIATNIETNDHHCIKFNYDKFQLKDGTTFLGDYLFQMSFKERDGKLLLVHYNANEWGVQMEGRSRVLCRINSATPLMKE